MKKLKKQLRAKILNRLLNISQKERAEKSSLIKKKIFALPEFKKAKRIMFYISKSSEVDTRPMIEQSIRMGKEVVVPAILPGSRELIPCRLHPHSNTIGMEAKDYRQGLVTGPHGVDQPEVSKDSLINSKKIDLFIIPGLAFDSKGNRLGRGQGYYDRFLARMSRCTPRIGVAFRFQIVNDLPCDRYDQPVNKLVSD